MITVFYDGKCGLCRREIEHYKRVAPPSVFAWVDITVTPMPFTALGFTVAAGLKALHVRDGDGIMHIGVDGFIVIWRALPRWRLLATLVGLPVVRPLARWFYSVFAAWRFKKRGYASCNISH